LEGKPAAPELWTLRRLMLAVQTIAVFVVVIQAASVPVRASGRRLRDVLLEWEYRHQDRMLDRLCDGPFLRAWWTDVAATATRCVSRQAARDELRQLRPDIVIGLQERRLDKELAECGEQGGIWMHVLRAPPIERISALVESTGRLGEQRWRFIPQFAPGETADILELKARVEATTALLRMLEALRARRAEVMETDPAAGGVVDPSGFAGMIGYIAAGRGKWSRAVVRTAVCSKKQQSKSP
jgi:hypothetical protein